jgi:CBS domain containing-hemolysin-like protein
MFLYGLLTLMIISAFIAQSSLFGFLQINVYELQAKARSGNKNAKKLYPLHRQGYDFLALLVFKSIVIHVIIIVILLSILPVVIAVILSPFIILVSSFVLPLIFSEKVGVSLLSWKADWLQKVLRYSSLVTKPLANFVEKKLDLHTPKLLGSKQELYKLLEIHTSSDDSTIAAHEIELVRHALDFSTKRVRDFMTPRRVVKRIASTDEVGPILVDELHKSGHSRFPVYDEKQVDSFVGILFLRDLIDVRNGGEVKQFMQRTVRYVHEEESLYYALNVILQTNKQLLVVVNTFEEFVGVISIEDILEQIIGAEIVDEFDKHDDLRAVAARMAEKEAIKHASKGAITDEK